MRLLFLASLTVLSIHCLECLPVYQQGQFSTKYYDYYGPWHYPYYNYNYNYNQYQHPINDYIQVTGLPITINIPGLITSVTNAIGTGVTTVRDILVQLFTQARTQQERDLLIALLKQERYDNHYDPFEGSDDKLPPYP